MKKLKCFLCGARYRPDDRGIATVIYPAGEEEPCPVACIRIGGRTLRLCPVCIKAVTLGMVLSGAGNESVARWGGEEIEYEED